MVATATTTASNIAVNDDRMIAYVIEQNKTLHTEVEKIKEEHKELQSEIETLEHDNDAMQKSKTVCIGYLKNMNEINLVRKDMVERYKAMYNRILLVCAIGMVAALAFNAIVLAVPNVMLQAAYSAVFGLAALYAARVTHRYHTASLVAISEMKDKLVKLEKANDLVMDLFDNM